jgi:hypothetical protein
VLTASFVSTPTVASPARSTRTGTARTWRSTIAGRGVVARACAGRELMTAKVFAAAGGTPVSA